MFKLPSKLINKWNKAISPSKVLQTFPSHTYKTLENTSIHKYIHFPDINAKFNTNFDSQIIIISLDSKQPKKLPIYQSEEFKTASYKNKIDKKLSPYVDEEQKIIVTVLPELEREHLIYPRIQNLLHSALATSFLSASKNGYKRPLIEYVTEGEFMRTAELQGMVDASYCERLLYPTLVCEAHEKLFVERLINQGATLHRVEALIPWIILAIILYILLSDPEKKEEKEIANNSSLQSGESVVNHKKILHEGMNDRKNENNDSWVSTVFKKFFA